MEQSEERQITGTNPETLVTSAEDCVWSAFNMNLFAGWTQRKHAAAEIYA